MGPAGGGGGGGAWAVGGQLYSRWVKELDSDEDVGWNSGTELKPLETGIPAGERERGRERGKEERVGEKTERERRERERGEEKEGEREGGRDHRSKKE